MTLTKTVVSFGLKTTTRILCSIDDQALENVPAHGPLILVANHINFMEVPLVFTHLLPRPVTGFAKSENWEQPLTRWLFSLWGAIPLRRGEADLNGIRLALEALEQGKILAVAPEGTRTGSGRLTRGNPGIVTLALRSGAPVMPLVYYGSETFWTNIKRLKRTPFNIRTGRPFYVRPTSETLTRSLRQQITAEIMYQLAALLPPEYRGVYADLSAASTDHLMFLDQANPPRL